MTESVDASAAQPSFQRDIRPLFRDRDRASMLTAFDLWSYEAVKSHQEAIVGAVKSGSMPCDGAWPAEQVAVLERWVAAGSQP